MRKGIHISSTGAAAAAGPPPVLRVVPVAAAPLPAVRLGDASAQLLPGTDISPAAVYLASLNPAGRRSMRSRLERAARYLQPNATIGTFPWASLRYEHLIYLRTRLTMAQCAPATINLTLVALRQTARAARQLGQLSAEAETALRDVRGVRLERLPRGRMLSSQEQTTLFRVCARDATARGRRDACLLALMLGCGLRREECAALDLANFSAAERLLRLTGKGGREASVPLKPAVAQAVADWLTVRGRKPGPLCTLVSWTGRVHVGRRLSAQAVYLIVRRLAATACIAPCTPHDLRRTFISELLDLTDGETARELARHANFATTGRYNRRGERAKVKALKLLSLPYKRPRPKRAPRKARKSRRRRHHA